MDHVVGEGGALVVQVPLDGLNMESCNPGVEVVEPQASLSVWCIPCFLWCVAWTVGECTEGVPDMFGDCGDFGVTQEDSCKSVCKFGEELSIDEVGGFLV